MKETRKLSIESKIFSRDDIIKVGNVIFEEFNQAQTLGKYSEVFFRIKCHDGTSYESNEMNIYAPGNIMDIKKADSIEIIFINYTEKNSINFQISEGYSLSYNYINVSGNNRNWVGGIFTKLKDIIDTIKPQENWTFKYKTPLFHIAALGIGNIIFPIMFGIMHEIVPVTPDSQLSANVLASRNFLRAYPSVALIIEKLMFPWMMGIGAAYPLRDWLIKLWNNIEFDFGPEHLKLNKQRRQRIFIFGSVIGFPILWDVIKYLFWGR